jgi:CDP-diglyceride synthetase
VELNNFQKRLLTSTVIVAVLVLLFVLRYFAGLFGVYFFDAFLLFLICVSIFETADIMKTNSRGAKEHIAIIVFALLYFFYIIGTQILDIPIIWWMQIAISVIIVGIFFLFIWLSNLTDKALAKRCSLEKKDFAKEALMGGVDLLRMLCYPGLMIACMIITNHMDGHIGVLGLLLVFMIAIFTDTFAYCVGITLGKGTKKMAPKLSPKKTWIGFIGGLFGGTLAALTVLWMMSGDMEVAQYLVTALGKAFSVKIVFIFVGILGALITTAGDLTASLLKRKSSVKDFAGYLPGHGGIMDRIDGLVFNAVFIFMVMEIILSLGASA